MTSCRAGRFWTRQLICLIAEYVDPMPKDLRSAHGNSRTGKLVWELRHEPVMERLEASILKWEYVPQSQRGDDDRSLSDYLTELNQTFGTGGMTFSFGQHSQDRVRMLP